MYKAWFGGIFACVLLSLVYTPVAPPPRAHKEKEKVVVVASPAPETERADDSGPPPQHHVYARTSGDLDHWLRGDWEPSGALLLVFTEEWASSLAYLIAGALDQTQVTLLVDPKTTSEGRIQRWLKEFNLPAGEIRFRWLALDSAWVRDYGPLQLVPSLGHEGDPLWLDTEYVSDRPHDDAVPSALAPEIGVEVASLPIALHGGAVISNGRGLCALTTEYCLDHGIDVEDPAFMDGLLTQIGCQVVALVPDLRDDSTRHADMFAQFLAPDVVAVARINGAENADDAVRMDEAARGIADAAARLGTPLRVVRIPMPYFGAGKYLTYLNGLRLPENFMVPSYRDAPADVQAEAYKLLAEALPGVKLVTVPADNIIPFSGSLHCISLGLTLPSWAGIRPPLVRSAD